MKESLGVITISAVRCSDSADYVSIRISDHDRKSVVIAEMDYAEFAKALTGSGDMKCVIKDYRIDHRAGAST